MIQMPDGRELDLLSVVTESVFIEDANGRIMFWNDGAARLYGQAANDMLGRQVEDIFDSARSATTEDGCRLFRRHADGADIPVMVRRSVLHDSTGHAVGILDASYDLSEHEKLDVDARYAEHRYLNMYNSVAVSFWELDISGLAEVSRLTEGRAATGGPDVALSTRIRIRHANDRTASFLGIDDPKTLQGLPVGQFWPSDEVAILERSLDTVLDGAEAVTAETWLIGNAGNRIDVLFTLSRLPDRDGTPSLLAGFVDVSDFKRAEQSARDAEARFRAIFQTLAVALLEIDFREVYRLLGTLATAGVADLVDHAVGHPDFVEDILSLARVIDANETAVTVFGGDSKEQLLGDVTPYWPKASRGVFLEAVNAGFSGKPRFETETRLATFDGRTIDVIFTAVTPPNSAKTGSIVIGIIDISDRVAVREAVERLQADLAHAARVSVLGELTASIAHEINQPLAAITTNGQAGLRWLARSPIDVDEVRSLTTAMVADAYRAADIIGRIRAMAANRRPERMVTALNPIVEEAASFLRHEIHSSGVALTLDLAPHLPMIDADRTQLQQVIVNIAMNGVQAMSAAAPAHRSLTIRTLRVDADALGVEIIDTGPGIAPEHLGRLFDSFFTTKDDGLGIGLPICRSIVEAHGGKIHVSNNEDGVGARFSFSLDLAKFQPVS